MNNDMISLRVFSMTSCLNALMSSVARALGDYLYYTSPLSLFSKIYRRRRPQESNQSPSRSCVIFIHAHARAPAQKPPRWWWLRRPRDRHTDRHRERERDLIKERAEKTRGTSLLFFLSGRQRRRGCIYYA